MTEEMLKASVKGKQNNYQNFNKPKLFREKNVIIIGIQNN